LIFSVFSVFTCFLLICLYFSSRLWILSHP
jgi:hypothetical protein